MAVDDATPARYRLVLRHPDGRTEAGALRRLRADSPSVGHAFSTLEDGQPITWEVVEERVVQDESGSSYRAFYAERDYGEQDGSLPDHQLEHVLDRRGEELPEGAVATLDRAVDSGLAVELVALDPGEEPDWEEAERYIAALGFDEIEDDLFAHCGVDTRRDAQDTWLGTVKERLTADLEGFRNDVESGHDEVEEWDFQGGRVFVSVGTLDDESNPNSGHGWLTRLFDAGVLGAAGFVRIRKAELLP